MKLFFYTEYYKYGNKMRFLSFVQHCSCKKKSVLEKRRYRNGSLIVPGSLSIQCMHLKFPPKTFVYEVV